MHPNEVRILPVSRFLAGFSLITILLGACGASPRPGAGRLADAAMGTEPNDASMKDSGPDGTAGAVDADHSNPIDAGPSSDDAATPNTPDAGSPGPEMLNPEWIGGPCQTVSDCPFTDGQCLPGADGYPGGMCTAPCAQFCPDQQGPLLTQTFCIDDGPTTGPGTCVSRCDFTLSATGCRAGYVCLPEKRMNESSSVRYACLPQGGVPGRPVPPFDIGNACATASDCAHNACITGLPGGYCTQEACNIVSCPIGSRCFTLGLEDVHVCLETCASSSSCRQSDGYTCDTDNTCWYAPPPPPPCELTNPDADCAQYSSQSSQDFVVVTKHKRRLVMCDGATSLGAFCIGLGASPIADKEREGDRRTPEGVFYVPRRIPSSQFYKAFLLSYPDSGDATRGLAAGLITQSEHDAIVSAQNAHVEPPQGTNLGGLIEIHGNGDGSDWTWGCIAAEDATIDVLWSFLDVGETIVVLH